MGDGRQVGAGQRQCLCQKVHSSLGFVLGRCASQIKFSPTLFLSVGKGGERDSNSKSESDSDSDSDSVRWHCLFTPQNFFNKHIRLTGQGSLVLRRMWAWLPFSLLLLCFSVFIENHLIMQAYPIASLCSIFSFRLVSFFASFCCFVFYISLPPLCFSFY